MEIIDLNVKFEPKGSGLPRSKASETGHIHLTTVIKYIESKIDPNKYANSAWDLDPTGEIGFFWEDLLEMVFANRMGQRPGEVLKDGIVGSPDGINIDPWDKVPIVDEEYKCTWKSSNSPVTDNWYYMTQFQSYCYMMDTNVTLLHILYLNGDYRGSGPCYRQYRIEFSQQELQETWDMIRRHAEEMWKKGLVK